MQTNSLVSKVFFLSMALLKHILFQPNFSNICALGDKPTFLKHDLLYIIKFKEGVILLFDIIYFY